MVVSNELNFLPVLLPLIFSFRSERVWVGTGMRTKADIPMGVAVLTRWCAMGSPASVGNASMRLKSLGQVRLAFIDKLLQLCNLSDFFVGSHFFLLVAVNGKSGRVITTVFLSCESVDENVANRLTILIKSQHLRFMSISLRSIITGTSEGAARRCVATVIQSG